MPTGSSSTLFRDPLWLTRRLDSVQDRTVPYSTGAIEVHDPFALARAKARKAATLRGEDPDTEVDIKEGGMEM